MAARLTYLDRQLAERKAGLKPPPPPPQTHDCAACGLIGEGCFGYGGLPTVAQSLWSCRDPECREVVRRLAETRDHQDVVRTVIEAERARASA